MRGGFRAQHGQWLRRGVTFRFTPVAGGVAMSFPLRAGDHASIASYLPASEARHRGSVVFDSHMTASVSGLQPSSVHAIDRGYASCCDDHLVAATAELRPRVNATVTYTVRARAAAGSAPAGGGGELLRTSHRRHHRRGGGGISAAAVAVAALGVLGALWIGAAVAGRRRRRARRRVRR
jgi:hypothetical protein